MTSFPSPNCSVPGCGSPVIELDGKALGRFCRPHLERYRRHGCAWLSSYTATDLNSYRRAVWEWLKANYECLGVRLAISVVEALVSKGSQEPIRRLPRQNAEIKASAIWGRFAEFQTDPKILVSAILAVSLRVDDDYRAGRVPSGEEYRQVQTAKLLIRLAGGSVRRWPARKDGGMPTILKSFVSSEGRVLRILGQSVSKVVESLSRSEFESLRGHVATFVLKAANKTIAPYPQNVRVKEKPRIAAPLKPSPSNPPNAFFAPDPDGGAARTFILNDDGSLTRLK